MLTAFVEQVLMLLWDAGLTVGHSFRSPKECVAMARDDLHSRTALTEARLVAGQRELLPGAAQRRWTALLRRAAARATASSTQMRRE